MATVASGLNSGSGFNSSDTITSTTLNNHVNNATVTGIVNADVASNAALAVTKLADITNNNLVGRVDNANNANVPIVIGGSGDAGVLFDNDDMLDNSDTAGGSATRGATQQSIKAYVDNGKINCLLTSTTSSIALNDGDVVPFNSEISDTSGMHDNSTNNSRITIGTAGVYIFTTTITTNETDNGDVSIAFLKNGSTELSRVYFDSGSTGSSIVVNLAHTALLSASDYVEVKIVQLSGDSTVVDGTKSTFNASLVS
jgi:hypothetical protein